MKKVYILALMLLMGQSSWAQIREFQTTRLNSTAGAGVASVLSTEAAILNPASSVFFSGSSLSYQRYSTSLRQESDERDVAGASISDSTAMGFTYRYLEDSRPKQFRHRHEVSHQLSLGMTHILDEKTIFGLILVDPTRTTKNEERAIAGIQYSFADKLTLIADAGTQYTQDARDKYLWRGAIQLQLFDDFFIRVGKFYDNIRESKGTGWGVGWIGPKLGVEFAQKFSEQFGKDSYIYRNETLVDTSLSAIIKF
jgi:hypothetical protein